MVHGLSLSTDQSAVLVIKFLFVPVTEILEASFFDLTNVMWLENTKCTL